jgi:hypothetical protein
MNTRKRGKVTVDMKALRRDHQSALAISRDLVIWRIDENIMMDTVTWWAESEHFEPVHEGEVPPEYEAHVATSDSGKLSVAWIKTTKETT